MQLRASFPLRLLMAGTGHRAAAAVAAAGGFSLLPVPVQLDDDGSDNPDQYERNEDRSCVVHDCLHSVLTPSGSVWWLPDTF